MDSPLFIDIVLYTIYVLLAAAVLLTVWSVVRGVRCEVRGENGEVRGTKYENGVPVRRIAWLTAGLLVVTLVVTWLTASTQPLTINGKTYSDAFWLRMSDMLINTALVLIVVLTITITLALTITKTKR